MGLPVPRNTLEQQLTGRAELRHHSHHTAAAGQQMNELTELHALHPNDLYRQSVTCKV